MTVIYAAARFEALRLDRKRHRERECRAILGQVPEAVAVAILIAVRDQSEEPPANQTLHEDSFFHFSARASHSNKIFIFT